MVYSIVRLVSVIVSKIAFGLEVHGKENIPKKEGFILASNHASFLDPVILGAACPRRLNFMARDDLFTSRWFGGFISCLNAFPVKRNNADIGALKEAIRRVKAGGALVLFPEGSRSSGDGLLEPQPGIGFIAAKLNAPVVPAFIRGSGEAWPRGAKAIQPKKISVYFGKQISIERRMPYQDIAQQIMKSIRHLSC